MEASALTESCVESDWQQLSTRLKSRVGLLQQETDPQGRSRLLQATVDDCSQLLAAGASPQLAETVEEFSKRLQPEERQGDARHQEARESVNAVGRLLCKLAEQQAADAAAPLQGAAPAVHEDERPAKRRRGLLTRSDVNVQRDDATVFKIAGQKFYACGLLLEAGSPFLKDTISALGTRQEIPLFSADRPVPSAIQYGLFQDAVEFVYTGGIEGLGPLRAVDLWLVADYLQMDSLVEHCRERVLRELADLDVFKRAFQESQAGAQSPLLCMEVPCMDYLMRNWDLQRLAWAVMDDDLDVAGPSSEVAAGSSQPFQVDEELDMSKHPSGIIPVLQNIVATVNFKCKLDLKNIALHARNAEYNPKRFAAVIMRIRNPKTTALIFASGKMVVTGAKSESAAHLAARKYCRIIQKLGNDAHFQEFKVQNIVGSCDVKFPIRLEGLAYTHGMFCSYEPELFPGLIYRMKQPKIVLLIFVSGKVVLTGAKQRSEIYQAFEAIYPVLQEFKKSDANTLALAGPAASQAQHGLEAGPSGSAAPLGLPAPQLAPPAPSSAPQQFANPVPHFGAPAPSIAPGNLAPNQF
ncbi:hypothetical protein WJX72_006000 [[Myrmecia] bisecta]|uniref:BTB domain-containing protein n=1 Tax=[Myrmecia] bisecta TaxID=41462 RepID=A0AAW1R7D4_9CHLO